MRDNGKRKEGIIARVYENAYTRQKLVTIPKKCKEIKCGDFVLIRRIGVSLPGEEKD